eukprot:TRINITY_DN3436_c0_g1_i2.p1 TRINITY_DN3436_c0_g1~~TRINITY_DN3436_c0_g1_i2.p1  ORF type:complete len:309 (-),score=46.67 TRINITY_DN3436_c0_g1_i2:169-1095(-)
MDCSVTQTKYPDLFQISTTDFFYPLVDDPYAQGRIGCANVLSDLYSFGVVDADNILMILASSNQMTESESFICTRLMMQGFNDLALEAGTIVTGGQTVVNPWPIIGGTVASLCKKDEFIMPVDAKPGDSIVLTKPLGTQIAVNLHQWINNERWQTVSHLVTKEDAIEAYEKSIDFMTRLNRNAARLMHKYGARACTDVTGFGILGHAQNLASNQKSNVDFLIHSLPIIKHMDKIDQLFPFFKLVLGYSAETSGGLLLCLPSSNALSFCRELEDLDGSPSYIVGTVIPRQDNNRGNLASIVSSPLIISV